MLSARRPCAAPLAVPVLAAVGLALLAAAGGASGCYRVRKALSVRTHVLGESFHSGPDLMHVKYDPDGDDGDAPMRHYALAPSKRIAEPRPPRLFKDAVIELFAADPDRDLDIRFYIKGDPSEGGDFKEVLSIVGEIPGELPNELVFLDDVFPLKRNPFRLIVADLSNPHSGVVLENADLILIRAEDRKTGEVQKIVFEYVEVGLRFGVYTNLLLSTGVTFRLRPEPFLLRAPRPFLERFETSDALAANFTLSFSIGWRAKAASGTLKWIGDNLAGIVSFGVGAINNLNPLAGQRLDFALVGGGGIQFLDMISLQILLPLQRTAGDAEPPFSTMFLAVGFDVAAAARFGRRITTRLLANTTIESLAGK